MINIQYVVITFFVAALISHGVYTFWKIRKHLHILQLNSYFNNRYFVWLRTRRIQPRDIAPLIALLGIFFRIPLIILVLFTLIYFRLFLLRTRLEEKKPLVYTPRAIRLFISNIMLLGLFYFGIFIFWWHHGDNFLKVMPILLVVYNFSVPLILMFTNLLIWPLEQLIQYRYFFSAQRYIQTLSQLKIVGVTGSFGKTTTKYVLTELLRQKFNVVMTPGSYNTTMGVTKVIRADLKPVHEVFVVEMSAKKSGDIKELCKLVQPQYGLITAIGEQHLDTFKTLANIKKTKGELIAALPANGIAVLNMDDINCRDLIALAHCRVVRYGIKTIETQLDYQVTDLKINESGSSFKVLRTRDNSQAVFQTKLLGMHNIYNILGAIALAAELGVGLREMINPLKQLSAFPHRLELKHVAKDIIFIDDAFNSNPVGSKMALEVLQQFTGKRKIIITPGMVELGTKQDEYNGRFGEYIAEVCDYVILVGKQQTLALHQGLKTKNYSAGAIFVAPDFAAAKQHLEQILQVGDVVLFENDLPDNYSG